MLDKDLEKADRKIIREKYNKLVLQYQEIQESYLRVKTNHKDKIFNLDDEFKNAKNGNSTVVKHRYYTEDDYEGKLSYFQQLSVMKCLLKTMSKKLRNYKNRLKQ
jgi:hypothetical protein